MAYGDTFNRVTKIDAPDFNNSKSSIEGQNSLLEQLSSTPNITHKIENASNDSNTTKQNKKPLGMVADYKDPNAMVNAMFMNSLNGLYSVKIGKNLKEAEENNAALQKYLR